MSKLFPWRTVSTFAIVGALFVSVLAAANPYDKFRNRQYSNQGYLSEQDELQLASQLHNELIKKYRLANDSRLTQYVNSIGQRLAKNSKRPNIPYQFYVVDDKSLNAFATLGGRVYVNTGLLAATESEAQLASVIGHEIGHIVGRHGLENVKRAQRYGALAGLAQIGGAILGGRTGAQIGGVAGSLLAGNALMKHSRDAEREADYLGLYTIKRAGYNTGGMIQMFEMLSEVSQNRPNILGDIMASHPNPSERAGNTRREIDLHLRGSDRTGTMDSQNFDRIKGYATSRSQLRN